MGSGAIKKTAEATSGALQRVQALEVGQQEIIKGVNESFTGIDSRLQTLEEVVTALTMAIGQEQVQDIVIANRKAQTEAQIEAAKNSVAQAVMDGKLVPSTIPSLEAIEADKDDELCSKYLVIGRELDEAGTALPPGRLQLPLSRILKEVRAKLAGGGPGLIVDTRENQKFALDEVYVEGAPVVAVEPVAEIAQASGQE